MEKIRPIENGSRAAELLRQMKNHEIQWPPIDKNFKLSAPHYCILKTARSNDDVYSMANYINEVKSKYPGNLKKQRELMRQNESLVLNMVKAGHLKEIKQGEFMVSPFTPKPKEFEPGKNHLDLLKKNEDGKIFSSKLKATIKRSDPKEEKRQKQFIDKMLETLHKNGYLTREERGVYQLTDKAEELLKNPNRYMRKRKQALKKDGFKITLFDNHIRDILDDTGLISAEKLNSHRRKDSLEARIKTLTDNGMIVDGKATEPFLSRLEEPNIWKKKNELTLEKMTPEQLTLMKDMRLFMNLSFSQIKNHIYNGDARNAKEDLEQMVKHRIIKRDTDTGIFIFDFGGVKLSKEMYPEKDHVRYTTKLHSKRSEIRHDMMVYDAFKHKEKEISARGGKITAILNDRQMRSDDARKYGAMRYSYPDLKVKYTLAGHEKEKTIDIEIDCGYDGKTIGNKIAGMLTGHYIGSLSWYCKNVHQATKAMKICEDKTKSIKMTRPVEFYVMGTDGKIHKVGKR